MASLPPLEIERHQLVLSYAHTRVQAPQRVRWLVSSMERFGQTTPVAVVRPAQPGSEGGPYVLVDGYRRVEALRRLGRDTVRAELWALEEAQAVLHALCRARARQWEAVEEALLLRDLRARFSLSLEELARRLARDPSWISRRLALVEQLPDPALEAVCRGQVSTWAASRVLVPLARANPDHARLLVQVLGRETLTTRQLAQWWEHYPSATRPVREQMVAEPTLFLRALQAQHASAEDQAVAAGPEGAWRKELAAVCRMLTRLTRRVPGLCSPDTPLAPELREAFESARARWHAFQAAVDGRSPHDRPSASPSDPHLARPTDADSPDRAPAGRVAKHGAPTAAHAPGREPARADLPG